MTGQYTTLGRCSWWQDSIQLLADGVVDNRTVFGFWQVNKVLIGRLIEHGCYSKLCLSLTCSFGMIVDYIDEEHLFWRVHNTAGCKPIFCHLVVDGWAIFGCWQKTIFGCLWINYIWLLMNSLYSVVHKLIILGCWQINNIWLLVD